MAGLVVSLLAPGLSVIKRFSHSSVLIQGHFVVTAGGFGEGDGRHQRLQDVAITDIVNMESTLVRCRSESIQCEFLKALSVFFFFLFFFSFLFFK